MATQIHFKMLINTSSQFTYSLTGFSFTKREDRDEPQEYHYLNVDPTTVSHPFIKLKKKSFKTGCVLLVFNGAYHVGCESVVHIFLKTLTPLQNNNQSTPVVQESIHAVLTVQGLLQNAVALLCICVCFIHMMLMANKTHHYEP